MPPEQVPVFRSDGAYIVTGGLGGLGLFLAEKMAAAGCGRIVLTSGRRPTPSAGDHRAHPLDRHRHRGRVRRYRRARHRRPAGGGGDRHRAAAAWGAARRRGRRGRHADQHHRRTGRTGLGAQGLRRVEPAPRHGAAAAGLVLRRSPRRPRWSVRRARVPTPRPTAGWTLSRIGGARRAFRPARSRGERGPRSARGTALAEDGDAAIAPDEGAYASRRAAARPRLHRLCPDHGNTVVDGVRAAQPVRRGVQVRWAKPIRAQANSSPSWLRCRGTSGRRGCAG